MGENRRTTYRISEAARELGISAEWLRVGEKRGFFPPALRDRNGHRYYTQEDIERMRKGRRERRMIAARTAHKANQKIPPAPTLLPRGGRGGSS
jgi:predicted site-specific integrase-resolvase